MWREERRDGGGEEQKSHRLPSKSRTVQSRAKSLSHSSAGSTAAAADIAARSIISICQHRFITYLLTYLLTAVAEAWLLLLFYAAALQPHPTVRLRQSAWVRLSFYGNTTTCSFLVIIFEDCIAVWPFSVAYYLHVDYLVELYRKTAHSLSKVVYKPKL